MVKFVRYADRRNIFINKKHLKGKSVSFVEGLTKERMIKLKEEEEQYGFIQVWTIDGKFYSKKMIVPVLNLKFIINKVSNYYVPFVEF